MCDQKLLHTLQKFYISTNLPIKAVTEDGQILGAKGYNSTFESMYQDFFIRDTSPLPPSPFKEEAFQILRCSDDHCFTMTRIIKNDTFNFRFILGPHTCQEHSPYHIPYKPHCLMSTLVQLLDLILEDTAIPAEGNCFYSYHTKKALSYISNHYHMDITLVDMVDYLNISKPYICTLLKKETGKTFSRLLNEIRIEKSKDLLLESEQTILDIALASGYNTQNYYTIVFKKYAGMTPLEYRQKERLKRIS